MRKQKTVVVSAVSFTEGGPLTILRDCLKSAVLHLSDEWRIIAIIHDRTLIEEPSVKVIEIPLAKGSWIRRLYCEWIYFYKISKGIKPELWLSLHDITPRVTAKRQVVYCHNPAPFYTLNWRECLMEPKFLLFNLFYRYLYGMFIRRNNLVVVQQEWMREEFYRSFGILPITVAHPVVSLSVLTRITNPGSKPLIFFYPALPRVFKNIEVLLEACRELSLKGECRFELRLTLCGDENVYARWLYQAYRDLKTVKFIGRQTKEQMLMQYSAADCVLFPSRLETWGLPISEAKAHSIPLVVSDLPYAHETVGNYDHVQFLPHDNAQIWADSMSAMIENRWTPDAAVGRQPLEPYDRNWSDLWARLVRDL